MNELIQELQNIQKEYCIINGEFMPLKEVHNMGYREFSIRSKFNMPLKLYKYFSNKDCIDKGEKVNYSIQALKTNTVFMQSPSLFDDVYDSDISLDFKKYEKNRLFEYCCRCQLNVNKNMSTQELVNILIQEILKSFKSTGRIDSIFKRAPKCLNEKLSNKIFIKSLELEINNNNDLESALYKVIVSDFESFSKGLKETFRTTCFATTPYSQLMWGGAYADCHKGFCIEYTIIPNDNKYNDLFYNLFPMIYCKIRPDMTERLTRFENSNPTEELLWDIYFNGALRKSIDWVFQNEWRLLLPKDKNLEKNNYCIPFFPITKVFLGNRMPISKRKEIIQICNEKNIPYIGIKRNPNIFEMQECEIKCEECQNYINNIDE